MKKTTKQWIDDAISLSPEEKQKAIEYSVRYVMPNGVQKNPLDTVVSSFQEAIMGSFQFSETEEGHRYWWNICLLEEMAMSKLYDYSAE